MSEEQIALFNTSGQRLYLNANERQTLELACHNADDPLASTFGLMLINTGCRLSEAVALTAASIHLQTDEVVFRTLKRRKLHFRSVPLSPSMVTQLKLVHNLSQRQNDEKKLWPYSRTTAWRRIKALMDKAGIEGPQASPKGFRHGFGIACIERNIPITVVQKWLGHSSPTTTAIYLQVVGPEERSFANRLWS